MKNFNTFRRGFTKNQYRGADCLKREGFGHFASLGVGEGSWKERGGDVFEGVGDTPMHTM